MSENDRQDVEHMLNRSAASAAKRILDMRLEAKEGTTYVDILEDLAGKLTDGPDVGLAMAGTVVTMMVEICKSKYGYSHDEAMKVTLALIELVSDVSNPGLESSIRVAKMADWLRKFTSHAGTNAPQN